MKKPDYLLLVNADHRLPDDFEDTIERLVEQQITDRGITFEEYWEETHGI